LRDGYQLIRAAGVPAATEIRASGGGTQSTLWRQILADVLGVPLASVATQEGAAFGAAILAAVGGGWHDSVGAATREWVNVVDRTPPGEAAYEVMYDIYTSQYALLRDTFARLGSVTS